MTAVNPTVEALRWVLDKLDTEDSDQERARLIDAAIALADVDPQAASEWEAHR